MLKEIRFGLVMSEDDKSALRFLADMDRRTEASVVRSLVWKEARKNGWCPSDYVPEPVEEE